MGRTSICRAEVHSPSRGFGVGAEEVEAEVRVWERACNGIGGHLGVPVCAAGGSGGHGYDRRGKRKLLQTVELKVSMDCEGCERKVKNALYSMKVDINRKQQKVTVAGYAEESKVLKKARSTGKKAEIWPYVPYSQVSQPYVASTYDKRAPAGYVRRAEPGYIQVSRQHDQLTDMFNDENANSCSVM
ncbi:hypothetical protein ACQ4PT_023631 [Festuca glaucescens]